MRRPEPGVPSAGWVYRFAAWVAFTIMRLQRWRFDVEGLAHVPRSGGAVVVANHQSFWDFFTVGRASYLGLGRPVRILAKASLFRVPVFGWLMRRAEHIPVHRGAGRDALESAVEALRQGELVLVLPEQTISRSLELLPFKSGAVRMAQAAGVPVIPAVTWGSHRFHTAGRRPRWSWRLPVSIRYGEPVRVGPEEDPDVATARLRERMRGMLDDLVLAYPDGAPEGAWWVPERFGGAAPHPEVDEAEVAGRVAEWQRRETGT